MNTELMTLIAGTAARPGTPTALWLGSFESEPVRRRRRDRRRRPRAWPWLRARLAGIQPAAR